jgi:nitrogen regulatory protein PII
MEIVDDKDCQMVVDTICEMGIGAVGMKIFVFPVEEVVRIRTGDEALRQFRSSKNLVTCF